MTYEEFLIQIENKVGIKLPSTIPGKKKGRSDSYFRWYDHQYENIVYRQDKQEYFLCNIWSTGGMTGGSCWDEGETRNYSYTNSEGEPEWLDITKILEHFCPNMTFLQFRALARLFKMDDFEVGGYYGNCTNYAVRYISLLDLYNFLKERKLVE
jgi:hypothetical protein